MKTKLISLRNINDAFYNDIKALSKVPVKALKSVFEKYSEKIFIEGRGIEAEEIVKIAKEFNLSGKEIVDASSASIFLFERESKENESISDIFDDLIELGKLSNDECKDILAKIDSIRELYKSKLKKHIDFEKRMKSVFPILTHLHSNSTLIPNWSNTFDRYKDTVGSYKGELNSLIPIGVVQIDVDFFGTEKRTSFALNINDIDNFINELSLLKKQLEDLQSKTTFTS